MSKEITIKTFDIDHERWFKQHFGFMPTQEQLELLCEYETGASMLLMNIFSNNNLYSGGKGTVKGYW